jgi:hypothetical protein
MMNGFYPQNLNGFTGTPFTNTIWNTGSYPFMPTFPGYANLDPCFYGALQHGSQAFNTFGANLWNTAFNQVNAWTPWNYASTLGAAIPTFNSIPFNSTGIQHNGLQINPSFQNALASVGSYTPSFVPAWNYGVQPWGTFNSYGYNTPFVNTMNYTNVGTPVSAPANFFPWYSSPTANYAGYLSSIAGAPISGLYTNGVFNTQGVNPTYSPFTGVPFSAVNAVPFTVPAGYPVTTVGQTPVHTDINGKVQAATIGLARNAA